MTKAKYRAYLMTPEWKERSLSAKALAGFRCRVCNGRVGLQTHHRTYERVGNEAMSDLTVLCNECHTLYEVNKRLPRVGK